MNDATKVTMGKPAVSGAISVAPLGSTLPTSATATLDGAFKTLGYISDGGFVNSNSPSTEQIKAWGGDIVATPLTEKADTFQTTFIEALDVNVLSLIYGSANVTGTLSTGITVRANSTDPEPVAMVCDMIMTGGVLKRIVIPNAVLTDLGDINYVDNDVVGYEATFTALPGDNTFGYDTHKEYIIEPAS